MMKIILIGNIGTGKTTIGTWLSKELSFPFYSIDQMRQEYSDGTVAGEYNAYTHFLEHIQSPKSCILEFSGVGIHKHAVRYALSIEEITYIIIEVSLTEKILNNRINKRISNIPYPFPSNIHDLMPKNQIELQQDKKNIFWDIPSVPHIIFQMQNDTYINNFDGMGENPRLPDQIQKLLKNIKNFIYNNEVQL